MKRRWKIPLRFISHFFIPIFVSLWIIAFFIFPASPYSLRALFILLFVLAFAILYAGVYRTVVQPLRDVKKAQQQFMAGQLNWRTHLVDFHDELGELGGQFNQLAEFVQERMQGLSTSVAESEALLASMEEGVLILDSQGRVRKMNAAMGNIISAFSTSDVGKHYLEVFRDPDLNQLILATLEGKQPRRASFTPIGAGRTGRTFLIQSSLIRDHDGGEDGVVIIFHDVTDLKRLERIRQEFVANVSHELRTPLTAIRGYIEALLDGGLERREEAERFLGIIARHTDRMEKIVSDLLLLSEMEAPDRSLRKESLAVPELVRSAADALQPIAATKKQSLTIQISSDVPPVRGDSQKIYQVLVNLLNNAIQYTPEKGQIGIQVRPATEGVEITVSDTGIGIPPSDLSRIFERFYRVDKGRSRESGGTGLGLSIVKHIVEAHGGRVWVESKPGQGSRFNFFLPWN
jgi:two-component system phosphate regulon sensor histidine kinase PhoR